MNRRNFVKSSLALSVSLAVSGRSMAFQQQYLQLYWKYQYREALPELFVRPPQPVGHYPAIVIGSGFGGAVSALRLGEAGVRTAVIERGNRWPNDPQRWIFAHDMFPDGRMFWHRTSSTFPALTLDPIFLEMRSQPISRFGGVLDVIDRAGDNYRGGSDILLGTAVGGGSVIYTAVTVKPKRRNWNAVYPPELDYDEMSSIYYPRVRSVLQHSNMPDDIYNSPPFKHCRDWDKEVSRAGYTPEKIEGNWNWDVVRGEMTGQYEPSATRGLTNFGNSNGCKNALDQNYIPMAEATGNVTVCHNHEVRNINYNGSVYVLDLVEYDPFGAVLNRKTVTCDKLIMAAGSYHTSRMMVRAKGKGHLPNLNQYVGKNWGDNGNRMAFRQPYIPYAWPGTQGTPSPTSIYVEDRHEDTVVVENWANAAIAEVGISMSLSVSVDLTNRGYFYYDAVTGDAVLHYPKALEASATRAVRKVNNRVAWYNYQKTGAPGFDDVIFTGAHPVGGMEIGKATDFYGRVKGYDGLYVMDGALIPGNNAGANPAYTIAAIAERNIERVIAEDF